MSQLRLSYPAHPLNLISPRVNQPFGANPADYAKFHDALGNPLKGHDGIDFYAPHGTPVRAAHDGLIHYEKDPHGGEGMSIKTNETYSYLGKQVHFRTLYWHLIGDTEPDKYPSPILTDGLQFPVKAGDLIGYADNTGYPYESSGDHLHFGLFPVDDHENTIGVDNGFNGRIDPAPYFTGIYADVVQPEIGLFQKLVTALKQLLSLKKN